MKKLLLTAMGVVMAAALGAQSFEGIGVTVEPVNVKKLQAAIAKSDADIADAKKNTKASTWIKRGDVLYDADSKPLNGTIQDMSEVMLKSTFGGEVTPVEETIGNYTYKVYPYDHFKAYVMGDKAVFYVATTVVDPEALDKAYDAYNEAYTLDAKGAQKRVAAGMINVHNASFDKGRTRHVLGDYKAAAKDFRRAWKASSHPSSATLDTAALYNAAMTEVYAGEYEAALADTEKAIELGYDQQGEAYYFKFISLYNLNRRAESLAALQRGIELYPTNVGLIDTIMRFYAENEGDPSSIIPLVQDAIAKNPTNSSLYQGLARVYDKLGQADNSIEAIKKSVELAPDDFFANHLEGLFIVKKGDAMNEKLSKMTITSRAQYEEALAEVNKVFMQALVPLEKAHALNPTEAVTVELLKNLTFRLRDEPGVNEKYQKYTEIFNKLEGK